MTNDTIMVQDAVIAHFYRLGYGLDDVGLILGIDPKTVRRHLVAQGIEIRPSNNVKRSEWLTVKGEIVKGEI